MTPLEKLLNRSDKTEIKKLNKKNNQIIVFLDLTIMVRISIIENLK